MQLNFASVDFLQHTQGKVESGELKRFWGGSFGICAPQTLTRLSQGVLVVHIRDERLNFRKSEDLIQVVAAGLA